MVIVASRSMTSPPDRSGPAPATQARSRAAARTGHFDLTGIDPGEQPIKITGRLQLSNDIRTRQRLIGHDVHRVPLRRTDRLVGSAWGAVPGSLPVRFPMPPAEPDVRLSPHPTLHVCFPMLNRQGCRFRSPRCRDVRAAVAVAGHRDAGRAGEYDSVGRESPTTVAESAQSTATDAMFASKPTGDPAPRVRVDRAECFLRHPMHKI